MDNQDKTLNVEFATNPDPRSACVLVLDNSGSMGGQPISELNAGLKAFETSLKQDELASRRVEVAVVSFGGSVQVVQEFVTASQFTAPILSADGGTPMGDAIDRSLQMVRDRKREYKASGVPYYQPWIFLITDGVPTDSWQRAAADVSSEIQAKTLSFFGVGVEGADMNVLGQITNRTVKLNGLRFAELFEWISQSQKRVSCSKPGQQVALPPAGGFAAPVGA